MVLMVTATFRDNSSKAAVNKKIFFGFKIVCLHLCRVSCYCDRIKISKY